MSLKRPTPTRALRRLGDSRREKAADAIVARPEPKKDLSEKPALKKAADSEREIRIARLKRKLADRKRAAALEKSPDSGVTVEQLRKKLADRRAARAAEAAKVETPKVEDAKAEVKAQDATFETTEENFKRIIKEAVGEAFRELGLVEEAEKIESEMEKSEMEKPEMEELERESEGEPEEEPEEAEAEPVEEAEEEEKVEDAELGLEQLLKDPKKKEALKALLDGSADLKKSKDAAAVFTSRYDVAEPAVSYVEPTKPKNRYE